MCTGDEQNKTGEGRKSEGKKTCMLIPGPGVAHAYIYVAGRDTATASCGLPLLRLSVVVAVGTSSSSSIAPASCRAVAQRSSMCRPVWSNAIAVILSYLI
ncbi:AIS_HP2_G0015990.mRNA.1.CDS.1 [Saccharomyces cerevisiae]|nr:AIS_HP2_G0015990.mRNA.1.CDS.1 [Saccharomyces cerevisiae]CAI6486469.1 AIS_HP2_G0015990.mRNA.1.CDS.1 [Saccharomyces cerevisiae]